MSVANFILKRGLTDIGKVTQMTSNQFGKGFVKYHTFLNRSSFRAYSTIERRVLLQSQNGLRSIVKHRSFATTSAAATEKAVNTPRGPLGTIFSFLPRWGSPGFWRKLGFYFILILIVNGLVTVGYYTMDRCFGTFLNINGEWKMVSDDYAHHHQLEIILNFPGDPAPLPPPASSAYIAITPVLNAPSEALPSATSTDPYKGKGDMSIVKKESEKQPVEIARSSSAGTSTVVSNKPIVSKTTEGYQSIYRSTSETIMPFIPVICIYFGDGICPKAYELFKHRDNQDYLNISQIPYFIQIFNRMDNTIKWEHRGFYGVLLFNKYMNHSIHNNLVNLDYSCKNIRELLDIIDNAVNKKALKELLNYATKHKFKFRKLKMLNLEGNDLTDLDMEQFCRAIRKGAYKNIDSLILKNNNLTELGLFQLCILLEEGYCSKLVSIDIEDNTVDTNCLGYKTLQDLLHKNMCSQDNANSLKIVTTYSLSDQHMSINSKVILQMFTKLTAKWNQLSRQMKFM